jgi:hypothetical protein
MYPANFMGPFKHNFAVLSSVKIAHAREVLHALGLRSYKHDTMEG